ncbi:MAG: hypothetical protein ACK5QV_15270 [Dolichospermum sp.]
MKAFEVMGKFDEKGQLLLDKPLEIHALKQVRVIILVPDETESDSDDTSVMEIKASLKTALQEAKAGKRIPLEKMWEGIDAEFCTSLDWERL